MRVVAHEQGFKPPGLFDRDRIVHGEFTSGFQTAGSLKVLSWNIERGLKLDAIVESIEREVPVLCILQEVDLNARRTGRVNIAECLARTFEMNYVWGAEFQESGQGDKDAPAYHGQATLTPYPIRASRVLRFARQSEYWAPRWFLPNWSMLQRRLGGRMALVAEIETGTSTLVVYNTHLESRGPWRLREEQLQEILKDVERYPAGTSFILAGDFNTRERPSPLIVLLERCGFRDAVNEPRAPTSTKGTTVDWIFVRGPVRVSNGAVLQRVFASDHFPVTALLSVVKGAAGQD